MRQTDVSAAHCINDADINIIIGVCVCIEIKITFTCATTVRHALFWVEDIPMCLNYNDKIILCLYSV